MYVIETSTFEFLEMLGEAGDKNKLESMANYCDEAYIHYGRYAIKLRSAWAEVWSGDCRSRARFLLPGVVLARFSIIFKFWEGLLI